MTRVFSTMKVIADLNLSRNKIRCQGGKAISIALLHNANSTLAVLNLSYCQIGGEGTSRLVSDLGTNKKLKKLNIDGNQVNDEMLNKIFIESLSMNRTLLSLSMANCDINDLRFQCIIEALAVNPHLKSLCLA